MNAAAANGKLQISLPKHFGEFPTEEVAVIKDLQNFLIATQVTAVQNTNGQVKPSENAYNVEVEYVLLQEQPDETTTPDEYCSRSLTKLGKSYNTIQREFFKIVLYLLLLQPSLEKNRINFYTDCSCLE